jgi:hypothetical protein
VGRATDDALGVIRTIVSQGNLSDLALDMVVEQIDVVRRDSAQPAKINGNGAHQDEAPNATAQIEPRKPLDWRALSILSPPARQWIIPHWIPDAHLTLLAGQGGVGKSLLAQHIGTAVAAGRQYLEPPTDAKRVLMWACEDDHDELWRRQGIISTALQCPIADLEDRLILHSYAGDDVTLVAPIFGKLEVTPMLAELAAQVKLYGAQFVILDNIARLYGGNENDRHAVTLFCALVQGACYPAAVLILGHPAKLASSEFSGSTAWEGAVRSRLYLSDRHPDEIVKPGEEAVVDPQVRYLSRRKANYSDKTVRKMAFVDGVFSLADEPSAGRSFFPDSAFNRDIVRRATAKLAERGLPCSASTASSNYLPKLCKQYGLLEGLTAQQLGATMRVMVMDGSLQQQRIGAYDNRTPRYGLVCTERPNA